jgi:hypothetical protein
MKFVVNGTLHPGKSREDLIAHPKDRFDIEVDPITRYLSDVR